MIKTAKQIDQILLSNNMMTWRLEELASDVHRQLQDHNKKCNIFFSMAIDELNDISDTAQVAVFVRVINKNFDFIIELLGLEFSHSTIKGSDLLETLKNLGEKNNMECGK
ncbi:hypothetical protein RF11_06899 [Thelohanellus kitauei]|uniref:General transcription factor II-I repeat domain-containing protein 2 n=1 Tax=Thelohanellus kitauei TaxID=669202 RepID=A0A0C2M3P5_THEKT|nr:hypothetical protein RF11_06899 [Thelohanellus kitauei]